MKKTSIVVLAVMLFFSAQALAATGCSLQFDWFRNLEEKTLHLKFCSSVEGAGVDARFVLLGEEQKVVAKENIESASGCVERIVEAEPAELSIAVTDYASKTQTQYKIPAVNKQYAAAGQGIGTGAVLGGEFTPANNPVLFLVLAAIALVALIGAVTWVIGVKT